VYYNFIWFFPLKHFRINTIFIEIDAHKIARKATPIHIYPSQKPAVENTARATEMIQPKIRVAI
jgi:hypothetical protein